MRTKPLEAATLHGDELIHTPIGDIELRHSYFDDEASRRLHDPHRRPAELAHHLVAGLEVADREEGAGAGEGGGHVEDWHAWRTPTA